MEIDENKDYTGTGVEEQEEITINSEADLEAYLNNGEGAAQEGAPTLEELEEAAAKDDATDEEKLAAVEAKVAAEAKAGETGDGKDGSPSAGEDGKDGIVADDKEYDSTLEYLNSQHELGLNLEDMPKNLTREEEAEAISGVIGRMVNGINNQMAQYEDVKTILQDPEVANFVQAKAEGKTMADFVQQYASTPEGLSDEALATDELKVKLPHLSEEDIAAQVQSMTDRDKLADFATKVREERQTVAIQNVENEKNQLALQQQQTEKTRIAEINDFGQFIQEKNDIYGIPLNTDMKKQIFSAATQVDKDGETYLEKALQSNEGVLLATAGLIHMDRLMKGYASLDVNQRKKSFMDTLFDTPDALQSASSEHEQKGFDIDAANQF